jgi:hypothetical protein
MRLAFILVAILSSSFLLHPIHVSVCDVELDRDKQRLEMTMRMFTDDLELQIRNELNEPTMDILNPPADYNTDKLLENYLNRHFKVAVNGKKVDYKYLGHEVEAGSIYCYMMVSDVTELQKLSITNDILLETYDDQVNLVHVEVDDDLQTMMFRENKRENVLTWP